MWKQFMKQSNNLFSSEPLVCQLSRQGHGWLATFGWDNR